MMGLEFLAIGALLFVVNVVLYSRYREVKERKDHQLHSSRTSRMKDTLVREVVEPVQDLPAEELTKGRAHDWLAEAEFLEEAPASAPAPSDEAYLAAPEEAEFAFLPSAQPGSATALMPVPDVREAVLHAPREERTNHVEVRLRNFEDFQRRSEAELSLLRQSVESLHHKIHEATRAPDAGAPARSKLTAAAFKERRDKLARELQVLQKRFMKRQVDAATYARLNADLQRELNQLTAEAIERAEALRPRKATPLARPAAPKARATPKRRK
jgi:hypothetical protein